jgi:flagellar hook assembly protein FlgD
MAFPNPCNPRTSIHMTLPPDAATDGTARVDIFDLRGARIRTLTGGRMANDADTVDWDGTGADGGAVASGQYMYVISAAGHTARGSLTLVR